MRPGAAPSPFRRRIGLRDTPIGCSTPMESISIGTSRMRQAHVWGAAYHWDRQRAIWWANGIIHAPCHNRGYGRAALLLLCDAARHAGIRVLHDALALGNPAPGVFLSVGFTEEYRTEAHVMLKKELAASPEDANTPLTNEPSSGGLMWEECVQGRLMSERRPAMPRFSGSPGSPGHHGRR